MEISSQGNEPRRIAVVAFPGCQSLDVLGPLEIFSTADALRSYRDPQARPLFRVEVLAPSAGPLRTSSGLTLVADRGFAEAEAIGAPKIDTLLVAGGNLRSALRNAEWVDWLRRQEPRVRRMGAVCTGSFMLAEAGILDGRRATTHWAAADHFDRKYTEVQVERDAIYVADGVYTSAGVTAGMDLALSLLEQDIGREAALEVARYLVIFLKRAGGQSQFSGRLAAQAAQPPSSWDRLLTWIADHPDENLTVEALAARVHLSPRHFSRLFSRQLGTTPAKWVEKTRIDHARGLLEERSELSLDEVARRCGLSESGVLRRLFIRHLGVTPGEYRRRFAPSLVTG